MIKRFHILPDPGAEAKKLASALGVSDVLARLLWNRGLRTVEAAKRFLDPEHLQESYDPFLMKDMDAAVSRIQNAIEQEESITIYGDYDVDGMTSVAVLSECLKELGAAPDVYIPDRFREGYGLNTPALQKLAETTDLLITVDCGIGSKAEIASVAGKMDVIVTDHHLPGEKLPDACAVVNPHRTDCPYPEKDLAGVGVAWKLCQALAKRLTGKPWEKGLALVALGTIADVVPLVGENRKLVRLGLAQMKETHAQGLRALIEVAATDAEHITSEAVGFQLAPRLNAAGRMESASLGARLLMTEDSREARALAIHLDELNRERQSVERDIQARAEQQIVEEGMEEAPALILAGEGWHQGVIGIVASRLVEKYYRPVILLSIDGDKAKGSCRSIPDLHMYEALAACGKHLMQFGGHAQAAGLSLLKEDIPAFRQAFCAYVAAHLTEEQKIPVVDIEFEMHPTDITLSLVEEIARLEPYGEGNRMPLFGVRDVRGVGARQIGTDGKHLKFSLCSTRVSSSVDMIAWGQGNLASFVNAEPLDLAYRPAINEWQGRRSVQGFIDTLQPAAASRIFPDRATLADLYRYLYGLQSAGTPIPMDAWKLAQGFTRARGQRIPLYTMKESLRVFSEIHLLTAPLAEDGYRLEIPQGKLDLMASATFRAHQKQGMQAVGNHPGGK